MYSLLVFDPINLFTDQSVSASTTSDPSDRLETTRLTKVQMWYDNVPVTIEPYAIATATGI
jgi:hypothetical protein